MIESVRGGRVVSEMEMQGEEVSMRFSKERLVNSEFKDNLSLHRGTQIRGT